MIKSIQVLLFFLLCFLFACNTNYVPKPRGYPRIEFPEKAYIAFDPADCPFSFEYPVYANITRDSLHLDAIMEDPCWLNISIPSLLGTIHMSYKKLGERNKLEDLLDDTHFMTFKHVVKAEFIDQGYISNRENDLYGLYYEVGGNAASPFQFYLTDSLSHFVRGALYFYTTPNADSLKPVIEFVRKDIDHLISTFHWKQL